MCIILVPLWIVVKFVSLQKSQGIKWAVVFVLMLLFFGVYNLSLQFAYATEYNDIIIAMKVYLIQLNAQDAAHVLACVIQTIWPCPHLYKNFMKSICTKVLLCSFTLYRVTLLYFIRLLFKCCSSVSAATKRKSFELMPQ